MKKHKKTLKNHLFNPIIWVVVLAVLVGGWMIKRFFIDDNSTKTANSSVSDMSKLSAIINEHHTNAGDEMFRPGDGEEYQILNVSVTQNFGTTMWLSPVVQSYIEDDQGAHYTMSPVTMDNPFDAKNYDSGQTATGEVSYMVKKSANGLKWCYEIQEQSAKICKPLE